MDFKNKPIFGMIHLSGSDNLNKVNRALAEIDIMTNEGVDGIIVENYHGSTDNVENVLMHLKEYRGYLGINILPNEYEASFKLATQYNADFIQLDYISGKYKPDIELDIDSYMDEMSKAPSSLKIFGGVWPKYYTPIYGSDLRNDIADALIFVDGIVVTGSGTGKETPLDKIKLFREHMNNSGNRKFRGNHLPLIIGAGLDSTNVIEQLPFAEGAIVGSCFKPYKLTNEMIDKNLVREFMDKVKQVRENIK